MYEYINGILTMITPYYIVVETSGVGYQIQVANPFAFSGKKNSEVKIFVHQVVREDSHLLFGFPTLDEKNLFLKLISVSGIGPKSALAILAGEDHEGLVLAVENEDAKYLTKFPGVGKKTAQQMILDLQGKLSNLVELSDEQIEKFATKPTGENEELNEAIEALKALGYKEKELAKVKKEFANETHTTEEYLKLAFKKLTR